MDFRVAREVNERRPRGVNTDIMKTNLICALVAACTVSALADGFWTGLGDGAHVSGPVLSEDDLDGKVVLVDTTFIPRIQEIWSSFKGKPFMTVGSVRVSGKIPSGITYPVYKKFGLAERDPGTKMFVVNDRGRVVYAGSSDRDATEALVTALGQVGMPVSLTGTVGLRKFKSMEKSLVLGKSIKSQVGRLESAVKAAERKSASKVQRADAAEAREILRAIADGKADARREIGRLMRSRPDQALKAIKEFSTTFPDDAAEYKEKIPELTERAKALKAAGKK